MRYTSSTTRPPPPPRQCPLRATGRHLHGAAPARPSLQDKRKRAVAAYPALNVHWSPAGISTRANKHPAMRCNTDRQLLNRIGFLLTRIKKKCFCKVSHRTLANRLGVCPETVCRHLKSRRDKGAIRWIRLRNKSGADSENEYFITLDYSRPDTRQRTTPPGVPPCGAPVAGITGYVRAGYTTRQARTARNGQQNRGPRHGIKKPAAGKRQPPLSGNGTIAVINCLDGSVFKFDEAYVDIFGSYWNWVDLRTLLPDLANWYEAHPDKRTNRTMLMKDIENRLAEWMTMDKYQLIE